MNDPQDRYRNGPQFTRSTEFDWCSRTAHLVFWGLPFGSTHLGDAHA